MINKKYVLSPLPRHVPKKLIYIEWTLTVLVFLKQVPYPPASWQTHCYTVPKVVLVCDILRRRSPCSDLICHQGWTARACLTGSFMGIFQFQYKRVSGGHSALFVSLILTATPDILLPFGLLSKPPTPPMVFAWLPLTDRVLILWGWFLLGTILSHWIESIFRGIDWLRGLSLLSTF